MVQAIPLSGKRGAGLSATVDDDDAELVAGYSWHLYESRSGGKYARTKIGRATVFMSEVITGRKRLDHRNGDGLDNTRDNLRKADSSQNGINSQKRQLRSGAASSSRFKGVSWHRVNRTWTAYVTFQRKRAYLGSFTDEEDAARAYDEAAVQLHGEFARTNEMLGLLPPANHNDAGQRLSKQHTSRFRGVYRHRENRWVTRIWYRGETVYIGSFADEEIAARAYDEAAVRLHGERAQTNMSLGLLPLISGGPDHAVQD